MNRAATSGDSKLESLIGRVADEYAERLNRGEKPDLEEYARQHPELADTLRRMLPAIEAMQALSDSTLDGGSSPGDPTSISGTLGDFRIRREIGRGGMGVVYEAEQISLKRRVALKVLPFAAVLDPRRLQRFKNEAQAAACLHHPHIVPVYAVGVERGVHYYAMQYIEGLTLKQVIDHLADENQLPKTARKLADPTADFRATTPFDPDDSFPEHPAPPSPADDESAVADTHPLAEFSTAASRSGKRWIEAVARLGAQVAEALDHAHNLGITHRDIKPSNLILDPHGNVWITDFGLAQIETSANLTMTGDVLGTLRYMSPEQASGQRGVLDHRTDVYSLGVTLYELLARRPAFTAAARAELVRQVSQDDPRPLAGAPHHVPRDLATIVFKAMSKAPAARYATGRDFAADLQRYLSREPIAARAPGVAERVAKWARRRPALSTALATTAALLIVAAIAGSVALAFRAQDLARRAVDVNHNLTEAIVQSQEFLEQARLTPEDPSLAWTQGRELARRAEALSENNLADPRLVQAVERLRAQLEEDEADRRLAARIDEALRVQIENFGDNGIEWERGLPVFAAAFEEWGLVPGETDLQHAAAKILARPPAIQTRILDALLSWGDLEIKFGPASGDEPSRTLWRKRLIERADVHTSDVARSVRTAIQARNVEALATLAGSFERTDLSPFTCLSLSSALFYEHRQSEAGLAALRKAQRHFPEDYWINYYLSLMLLERSPPLHDEAVRYATAALALRPDSEVSWLGLGNSLWEAERLEEAAAWYRQMTEVMPSSANAYNNLGVVLNAQGDGKGAGEAYRKAAALAPQDPAPPTNLGNLLAEQGDLDAARQAFDLALKREPTSALVNYNFGVLLVRQHAWDQARAAYEKALTLDPKYAEAQFNLGGVLANQGDLDGAIGAFRKTLELRPGWADAESSLAEAIEERNSGGPHKSPKELPLEFIQPPEG